MTAVLSESDLAAFAARGYVVVHGAFSSESALAMQETMWDELREGFGIERNDRDTWHQPPRDLQRSKTDPAQNAITLGRLREACEALLGAGRWKAPAHWGRILVTFPEESNEPWRVPTGPWHWDSTLHENVGSLERLLILTFFSNVEPRGGGTLIVEGSHRLLERFHGELSPSERTLDHRKLRKRFLSSEPWLRALTGLEDAPTDRNDFFMKTRREVCGVEVRVVELTGRPGDAVICHPLLLHTSGPNRLDVPRFMRIKFPGKTDVHEPHPG